MSDGHAHDSRGTVHAPNELSPFARRAEAMEALLVEKGIFTRDEVQRTMKAWAARSPADGARLVARAWVDPAFKARLIADPKAAALELGIDAATPATLVVAENTEKLHHLVVCTL